MIFVLHQGFIDKDCNYFITYDMLIRLYGLDKDVCIDVSKFDKSDDRDVIHLYPLSVGSDYKLVLAKLVTAYSSEYGRVLEDMVNKYKDGNKLNVEEFCNKHLCYTPISVCLHDSCTKCHGSGIRRNGSICHHMFSCKCTKCSPNGSYNS